MESPSVREMACFEIRLREPFEDSSAQGEQRFVSVGMNVFGNLRVIVYAFRGEDVRIISVRKAEPKEIRAYEEGI